jgi:hypothetical protein
MATLRLCERFGCLPDQIDAQSTRLLRLVAAERAYRDVIAGRPPATLRAVTGG